MILATIIRTIVYVNGYDIWFYTMHRAMHANPALYKLHKKHHSVRDVSWRSATLADNVETIMTPFGLLLPIPLVGFSLPAILTAYGYCSLRAFAHHEPRCAWLVGDYHLQHHRNPRVNYGQPWLDKLFGTHMVKRRL